MEIVITQETGQGSNKYIRRLAFQSFKKFFVLFFNGKLLKRKERLDCTYEIKNKGAYSVFRETMSTQNMHEIPIILVVGFRLKRIGSNSFFHFLFQRVCIITTPFWSGLPGFYIKLWMVDKATKNYAGIYEWKGMENARRYIKFLLPVLNFFSIKGSVWYSVYPARELKSLPLHFDPALKNA